MLASHCLNQYKPAFGSQLEQWKTSSYCQRGSHVQNLVHWCVCVRARTRVCATERERQSNRRTKKCAANFLLIFSPQGPRLRQLHGVWAKTTSSTLSSPPSFAHCLSPAREPITLHSDHFFLPPKFPSSCRQRLENQCIIKGREKNNLPMMDGVFFLSRFFSGIYSVTVSPYVYAIYFWRKGSCIKCSTYHVQAVKKCHTWAS